MTGKRTAAGVKTAGVKPAGRAAGTKPAAVKKPAGTKPAAAKKPTGTKPDAAKKPAAAKPAAKRPEKPKGIQVPPAVPTPLFNENGALTIREAILAEVLGVRSTLPEASLPEIAFAGKSNVGKSSLLNALVGRKALARTSSEPGKTRTINYYRVNGRLFFVDLPGYGYAKAGAGEKASWGRMIERYLNRSEQLKLLFLLVDSRHAPGQNDILMYDWILHQGFRPVIIATKCDKLKRSQLKAQETLIRETLSLDQDTPVILFSAETGQGREEVFRLIERIISPPGSPEDSAG